MPTFFLDVDMLTWLFDELAEHEDLDDFREQLLRINGPMIATHIRSQEQLATLMTELPDFATRLVEAMLFTKTASNKDWQTSDTFSDFSDVSKMKFTINNESQISVRTKPHIPLNEDSDEDMEDL